MSSEEAKACAEAARMSAEDPKYDWIPGSRRPDGTFRAPIKVKKGYVPQDEMKRFETKGSQ
jgi:partner of Y14 and mago protein